MLINVQRNHPDSKLPKQATPGSACFDLYSCSGVPIPVTKDHPAIINTGIVLEIPTGFVGLIYSRSGHGFKNDIRLANSVGVIDSDFRGEIKVKLVADGLEYVVQPYERIAQLMIIPIPLVYFVEAASSLSATSRGSGGFGSTGS
jgi:dUTP pyrophosphatase